MSRSKQSSKRKLFRDIVEKLARKERLSESEGAKLEAWLTPVMLPLVVAAVRRHVCSCGEATVEDVMQESWVILLGDILPRYSSDRGKPLRFIRRCLRRRLINLLIRGKRIPMRLLPLADTLPGKSLAERASLEIIEESNTLLAEVMSRSNIKKRRVFGLWLAGVPYSAIALESNLSEVAARCTVNRMLNSLRAVHLKANI